MRNEAPNNRNHILKTAETLFVDKGFDGTSVDSIAKTAGVNKALIYYYFKNKDDVILSLFSEMALEMGREANEADVPRDDADALTAKVAQEIAYLSDRRDTLTLLMMESLKRSNDGSLLFQIAKVLIRRELTARGFNEDGADVHSIAQTKMAIVHEFFTGIIPVIAFVTMHEKFAAYFDFEHDELEQLFLDALKCAHFASHVPAKPLT
ncbi:MAG: TetR/AcrR family transcriptional regulator [Hyphomicrobiales bacterium]|nr:TetR/AcrR family transcriptional regulator [Hyphomicrobiales bacterium]